MTGPTKRRDLHEAATVDVGAHPRLHGLDDPRTWGACHRRPARCASTDAPRILIAFGDQRREHGARVRRPAPSAARAIAGDSGVWRNQDSLRMPAARHWECGLPRNSPEQPSRGTAVRAGGVRSLVDLETPGTHAHCCRCRGDEWLTNATWSDPKDTGKPVRPRVSLGSTYNLSK
jgi:hypothetical protein